MFKKVLSISLVLFGLEFFGTAGECFADASAQLEQAEAYEKNLDYGQAETAYKAIVTGYPGTDHALEAQKKLIMMYKHEQPLAKTAFQKLVADFSTYQLLPKTVYDIAEYYSETRSHKKYKITKQLYQHILGNWSDSPYAVWAQSGLAISEINLNNTEAAWAEVTKLINNFSANHNIDKAVYDIARQYNFSRKYDEAKQLYQYVINNCPQAKAPMWQQIDSAHSNIAIGNDTAAQVGIDELVANISNYDFIAGALYDIAEHYSRLEKYEKARQIYQYIVDNKPEDYYAIESQMYVVMSDISLGNEAAAQAAIEKLTADFSQDQHIADAILVIADHYGKLGNYAKAVQYYQYILDHWPTHEHWSIWVQIDLALVHIALGNNATVEGIIDGFVAKLNAGVPAYTHWPAVGGEGYFLAGDCYSQIGKNEKALECFEKVAADYPGHRRACSALSAIRSNCEILENSGTISESEADAKIKAAYEQLLEKYPDDPEAKDARDWMNRHNSK